MTTPKGKQLYNPRGREAVENACILADCLAASTVDLFSQDNSVILVAAGKKVAVTMDLLREICTTVVVTKVPVETAEGWVVNYVPFEPDHAALRALLTGRTLSEGNLALRLPKAPSIRQLAPQIRQQVSDRLRRGEAAWGIASSLGCEVEVVEALRGGVGVAPDHAIPGPYREHAEAVKRQDG